jgi:hypothetical protein
VASLTLNLPPSLVSKKIICLAYVAAPFDSKDRFRFQALHAFVVLKVVRRHLKLGYKLLAIEQRVNGARIDVAFETPQGKRRMNEVKSAKNLNEVHFNQAALYWSPHWDEVAVSNSEKDVVLTEDLIRTVQHQAEITRQLLISRPDLAAFTFTPNKAVCTTCVNYQCPFVIKRSAVDASSRGLKT